MSDQYALPAESLDGIALIGKERLRQIGKLGYTFDHDDKHFNGDLAAAALCYLGTAYLNSARSYDLLRLRWPSVASWGHPIDIVDPADSRQKQTAERIRRLTVAGALIAAEIDRLARLKEALPEVPDKIVYTKIPVHEQVRLDDVAMCKNGTVRPVCTYAEDALAYYRRDL